MLPKAFTGKRAFSEFTTPTVISKVMNGKRPARPQETQELGLTDSLWDMTVRCWHQDPAQRPTMTEVVELLRELLVSSLSIEADLNGLLQAYKTWDKDGQGKKAQEFADRLDEVCHTEGHAIASSHHISRFLMLQIFTDEDANICGLCKSYVVTSAFFHPRLSSRQHPLNAMLLPLPQAATRRCTGQPLMVVLL